MADPSEPGRGLRDYARFAALGLQFGFTILVFAGAGYALDRWLGAAPLGLVVGILLGGAGAFWTLYRSIFPRAGSK